jgi:hypothetical protein
MSFSVATWHRGNKIALTVSGANDPEVDKEWRSSVTNEYL